MKLFRMMAVCFWGAAALATTHAQSYIFSTLAGNAGYGSVDGTNSDARFNVSRGVAVDATGSVYVADQYNHTVRKLSCVGTNWVVTTVAGLAGVSGSADGPNRQARFTFPKGLTVDGAGNLYVADTGNKTIRKITPEGTNWVVSTLAGQPGVSGGADGTNTEARFVSPAAVAIDKAGDLFVADRGAVRKAVRAGTNWVVSTLAGLAGTSGSVDGTNSQARFSVIEGIAVDDAQSIFVTDWGNTIRKVVPIGADWVVATLAGKAGASGSADGTNSEARFHSPAGLAVDRLGNLYVADTGNALIRQVTPVGTNWAVKTLAGLPGISGSADGPTALFGSPIGITVDSTGNIYVADSNNTIRKLSRSEKGWTVSTLAGLAAATSSRDGLGSRAAFNHPSGAALDQAGNIYVADSYSHTIRQITPAGAVTTIAGLTGNEGTDDGTNGSARFSYPGGITVDSAGTFYVADGAGTIRKLVAIGTNWVVSTIAGSPWARGSADGTNSTALFQAWLCGIAADHEGHLYVGDYFNNTIRKVTPVGTNWVVTTLAGLAGVEGCADGTNADARFHFPDGIAVDRAGRLYV